MPDTKAPAPLTAQTAAVKLWTDRLRPAIGAALLPELIRLIGEYCLSRLSWSATHRSKRIAITDADADGFGRCITFLDEPPAGQTEGKSSAGWDAVISSAPLSELAGASSIFSWAIALVLDGNGMCLGVALPSSSVLPNSYAADADAYGVWTGDLTCTYWAHGNALVPRPTARDKPLPEPRKLEAGQRRACRLTADLAANTLSYALQIITVPSAGEGASASAPIVVWSAEHESWRIGVQTRGLSRLRRLCSSCQTDTARLIACRRAVERTHVHRVDASADVCPDVRVSRFVRGRAERAMSVADTKAPAVASATLKEALKLWTDRLRPAIGTALLPELIRLISEYCPSRLSWSPTHRSKRIAITDADADGFGRSLTFLREPPPGQKEGGSASDWDAVISTAPLSELAGSSSAFSWALAIDKEGAGMCLGVALPTLRLTPRNFAADAEAYGVWTMNLMCTEWVHNNSSLTGPQGTRRLSNLPKPRAGQWRLLRLTADLAANVLSYVVQTATIAPATPGTPAAVTTVLAAVDHESWRTAIPELGRYHVYAASGVPTQLTLLY